MIDAETARVTRLIGLVGLVVSLACWAWAERSSSRKALIWLSAALAIVFGLIYFLGVFADADSGGRRLLPRFP